MFLSFLAASSTLRRSGNVVSIIFALCLSYLFPSFLSALLSFFLFFPFLLSFPFSFSPFLSCFLSLSFSLSFLSSFSLFVFIIAVHTIACMRCEVCLRSTRLVSPLVIDFCLGCCSTFSFWLLRPRMPVRPRARLENREPGRVVFVPVFLQPIWAVGAWRFTVECGLVACGR